MASIPQSAIESPTVTAIYRDYESRSESPRVHLGASLIGRECERQLWYAFRWVCHKQFEGRILRLFETGQLQEDRLIDNLRRVGVEVHSFDPATGRQYGFKDFGGHFAGSIDGAAKGILEAPASWHLLEFKTHNEKRFNMVKNNGVQAAMTEHYDQMVTYMSYMHLERAYYMAVNKNTDEIYGERIKADPVRAELLRRKAERIIFAARPPSRISENPSFWKCKFCDAYSVCHGGQAWERNCRTCRHSLPCAGGGWFCKLKDESVGMLTYDQQLQGCGDNWEVILCE